MYVYAFGRIPLHVWSPRRRGLYPLAFPRDGHPCPRRDSNRNPSKPRLISRGHQDRFIPCLYLYNLCKPSSIVLMYLSRFQPSTLSHTLASQFLVLGEVLWRVTPCRYASGCERSCWSDFEGSGSPIKVTNVRNHSPTDTASHQSSAAPL